jgi:hypothetical protein
MCTNRGGKLRLGMVKKTLFWKDIWLYDKPISIIFSDLFKLCPQQDITVAQVRNDLSSVKFRRWLVDQWLNDWENFFVTLVSINSVQERMLSPGN